MSSRQSFRQAKNGDISLGEPLWHWSVTIFSNYFMDVKQWPLSYQETSAQQSTVAMGSHPLWDLQHMFTFLRRWTLLSTRYKRAKRLIQRLDDALVALAESRKVAASPIVSRAKLAQRLACAHEQGLPSSAHYRSNLEQLLVAVHENIEVVLQSALYGLLLTTAKYRHARMAAHRS
ncbi:hypothetical protein NLG97_g4879 [Lecanicillium saksenae]|uniref:Uncharacterized protein n=1 Tax=Lecanicillium saksenae TaxID=468837 RepID=A0ACC1QWJ3_9HYPO|nr:hypothetical protein NLG97_g4879 [Lecanicillium saksenae]